MRSIQEEDEWNFSGAQVTADEQPQRSSHSTEPDIEVGILVAVDLQQYEEWPQIGKVLHVTGETLKFSGMMVLTLVDTSKEEGYRKIYMYWNETTIPLVSVVLANVELMHSCQLQKNIISHLKAHTRNGKM